VQNRKYNVVLTKQSARRDRSLAAVGIDWHFQRAPHCFQAERARIACGTQQGLFSLGPPAALLVDADQTPARSDRVERDENITGRQQRHFVLCRAAAEENDDAGLVHA